MTLGSDQGAVAPSMDGQRCIICGEPATRGLDIGGPLWWCDYHGPMGPQFMRERAEGPPELTDWKARAEKAERERDCYLAQRDTANEQMRRLMDESESALAEERRKGDEARQALRYAILALDHGGPICNRHHEPDHPSPCDCGRPEFVATLQHTLASGNAPPPQDSQILSSCSRDCTTGSEGGVLHSVEHQYRLAGGSIKTCPVCGEERHGGTCVDAASGNAPEKDQGAAAPQSPPRIPLDEHGNCLACGSYAHGFAPGERPAGPPDYDPITAPIPAGDWLGPHGPLPEPEEK